MCIRDSIQGVGCEGGQSVTGVSAVSAVAVVHDELGAAVEAGNNIIASADGALVQVDGGIIGKMCIRDSLKTLTARDRTRALISLAHPDCRSDLTAQASKMGIL